MPPNNKNSKQNKRDSGEKHKLAERTPTSTVLPERHQPISKPQPPERSNGDSKG